MISVDLIRHFGAISKDDAALAGGKGASLGEMTGAGIPVPPGFVVLSTAFEWFLEETDLRAEIDAQLARVDKEKMHTVEDASAKIQELIREAKMPEDIKTLIQSNFKELDSEFVAVRSSATAEDSASAAWAGQLDSYLNTTEDSLLLNVQRCWASLFTPRAIFYRFEKELHETHISVAVVVQKMVESETSGIAFSVHPVTEDYNQLIIEAGFGLGEAIVSGQVTPDSYVVEKEPRRIIDTNVATQTRALYRKEGGGNEWKDIQESMASSRVLTENQVLELSELVIRIEKHYGFPCDIEWAYEAGKFYIVQSRPITTLALQVEQTREELFFKEFELDAHEKWNEQGRWVLPPFVSSTMSHHHMLSSFADELLPSIPVKAYFVLDFYAFQLKKDKRAIFEYTKKLYHEGGLESLNRKIDALGGDILGKFEKELQKDEAYRREHSVELLGLYRDLNDFWLLESYFGDLCIDLAKDVGYIQSDAELFGKVQPYLRDTWIEEEVHDAVVIAEYCIENDLDPSSGKDEKLATLLAEYVEKYSWSKYSWFIGQPVGIDYAVERVGQEIQNVRAHNHIRIEKRADAPESLVGLSVVTSYWRAQCGRMIMMAGERLSFLFDAVAEANQITKDEALLLTYQEVNSLLTAKDWRIPNLSEVLARKEGHFIMGDNQGGLIVFGHSDTRYTPLKKLFIDRPVEIQGNTLKGIAASPGTITGKVRVIQSAKEFGTFHEGEILVSVETSPIFVPLMRKASAILTGKGGITSHAAIVSRELKKPCVIAIKDIVKILKTGDMVEVDANQGTVRILSSKEHTFNSPGLSDFKPEEWQFMGTYAQPLFPASFWGVYFDSKPIEDCGFSMPYMGNIVCMGGSVVYSKPVYADIERQLRSFIDANTVEPLLKLKEKAEVVWKKSMLFAEKMAEAPITIENFEEILRRGRELTLFWCMSGAHLNYSMERIAQEQIVADHIPAEIAPSLIPKVVTPSVNQQKEFFELKAKIAGLTLEQVLVDTELTVVLQSHVRTYGWIEIANWAGEPLTLEHLYERLQGDAVPTETPEHALLLSARMQTILGILGEVLYIKQSGAEYASIYQWKLRPFFLRLCEKVGITYEEMLNLSFDEVRGAIAGTYTAGDLKRFSSERGNNWLVLATTPGKVTEVFDVEDLQKLAAVWMPKADESATSVSGQIGHKGEATGPARVILSLKDFGKMRDGDVLVTTMTTPEFVLLMQKASAIVTNMGGLLCHAAIVSRELNKPCIINTKVATQVFKDGDELEVDANNGVVKILKRA